MHPRSTPARSNLRWAVLLACVVLPTGAVAGCDGKPEVRTEPVAQPKEVAPPEAGTTGEVESGSPDDRGIHAPPADPKALAEARKRFVVTLNEGRSLTKAGDFAGGMAKYRQALEIDPADPAALAELGWAAFRAEEFDVAQQFTSRALNFSHDPKQQGMIHYNLGRIAEARDQKDRAIDEYRRSLELRDNETVKKRLASLAGADAASAGTPADGKLRGLGVIAEGLPSLDKACTLLVEQVCKGDLGFDGETCTCDPKLEPTAADPSWGLLTLKVSPAGEEVFHHPVVKTDGGWTLFNLAAYEYNPGAFGIFEELDVPYQKVEGILGSGAPALVIQISKGRMDRDMGLEEIEFESEAVTIVCSRAGKTARCTPPLLREYTYEREVEAFGETPDPEIDHEGLPVKMSWNVTLGFANGRLTVEGETPEEVKFREGAGSDGINMAAISGALMLPNGEHELVDLMAR